MTYREYLKSDKWNVMRNIALIRADFKCQLCNGTEKLNVHHRKYPKVLGSEPITDLIVLCRECHENHHRINPPSKCDSSRFKGKTSEYGSKYHVWIKDGKTFYALCNPGLVRKHESIFSAKDGDKMCKVCAYHSKLLK